MYSYSLLLLAAIQAVVVTSNTSTRALRRRTNVHQESSQEIPQVSSRRRLLNEITCHLFIRDIMYSKTHQRPHGYATEEWDCEFDAETSKDLGIAFAKIEQQDFVNIDGNAKQHKAHDSILEHAISGVSTLTINSAVIDTESMKMYLPSDATVQVRTERDRERRMETKNTGDFKTIMVRLIDSKNNQPTRTIEELKNDVFEDSSCLKTQMAKCSYNKVNIQPYNNVGVFDLNVDFDTSSADSKPDQFHNAALQAFNEKFGSPYDKSKFDLVMFCNPPTSGHQFAWGQVNGPISNYPDNWCGAVAGQMHEVGHNLGLQHSGEGEQDYADTTGYMGSSSLGDDYQMCYNAAKSWQLGWYDNKELSINPLDANNPVQQVTINGVNDYEKNPNAMIAVQLQQTDLDYHYYIGYNRNAGMNADTSESKDMITILKKDGSGDASTKSWKVASLLPGNSFTIDNFNNQRPVQVKFYARTNSLRDAIVEITDLNNKPNTPEENCEPHVVEIMTDSYPGDNSWVLVETSGEQRGFGNPAVMADGKTLYRTPACLPYSKTFEFTIFDGYGDGIGEEGYYKILNSKNQVKASGSSNFGGKAVKSFSTGADPNPAPSPTKAPTFKPTHAPTPFPTKAPTDTTGDSECEEYTIEIKTDNYPEDTSWKILNNFGNEKFSRTTYSDANAVQTDKVCLKKGKKWTFVMADSYGDGVCCKQGDGYYKVKDSSGTVIVEGETGEFSSREHEFNVASDDSPPPCEKFTIEVMTDKYPEDNSWKILDPSGTETHSRASFNAGSTVFTDEVCLEQNMDYTFQMEDSYGDGVCCSQGNGYYKIKDSNGVVVVDSDDGDFSSREHTISVGTRTVDPAPTTCEDKEGKFQWKPTSKFRTCDFWSTYKCDVINQFTNEPIWKDCPVSCNRCPDL